MKVYCNECRYMWWSYLADENSWVVLCHHPKVGTDSFFSRGRFKPTCESLNKNNDCKLFLKKSLMSFLESLIK